MNYQHTNKIHHTHRASLGVCGAKNGGATSKSHESGRERSFLGFLSAFLVSSLMLLAFGFIHTTSAAPSYTMNYQGKLTNASGVAVADGTYNMRFWIATSPTIATTSALWTEELTTTNRVQVTNGLFSIMLGSTTPLTGIDWNQPLYLGVEVGGTTTPAWDGEMSPRKILGTVPSAFEAKNASTVGGLATTSLLRSDQDDTASGLLTFTGGLISNSSTTITDLTTLTATTTNFIINGQRFTNLIGTGLTNNSGTLTVSLGTNISAGEIADGDHGFFSYASGIASLDANGLTSANLLSSLSDETGTGYSVFSTNPLLSGFRSSASSTIGDGTAIGGLTIYGGATTTLNSYFGGSLGIGTNALSNMKFKIETSTSTVVEGYDNQSKIASMSHVTIATGNIQLTPAFVCGDNITFTYNGTSTTYGTLTGEDGNCWMDRNLGATRVALSSTDASSYGHLFQWGRADDGHQVTSSGVTSTNADVPGHNLFITESTAPYDWRVNQDGTLWASSTSTNTPCPPDWHVPTQPEWDAWVTAASVTNSATAYSSSLKLPVAGYRSRVGGSLFNRGSYGSYWSSGASGSNALGLYFNSGGVDPANVNYRASGFSVRCVQD